MLHSFRESGWLNRGTAAILFVTLTTTPIATVVRTTATLVGLLSFRAALAGPIEQGAAEGKSAAEEFRSDFQMPAFDSGSVTVSSGMSSPVTVNQSELFPGSSVGDLNSFTSTYGSDPDVWNLGVNAQSTLSTESSATGDAYRILQEQAAAPKPDMRNDPLWSLSDETLGSLDLLKDQFADCKATSTYEEAEETVHVPEYEYCTRVEDHSGSCEVRHNYSLKPILEVVQGPLNRSSCGEGCIDVWLGEVGNNYWEGTCLIEEVETWLQIRNPDAIISATLNYAKWDDWLRITLNEQQIWSGPYGGDRLEVVDQCYEYDDWGNCKGYRKRVQYSETDFGSCELSKSWQRDLDVDVTSHFKNVAPDDILKFHNRVVVSGAGEGYARIRIYFDPTKAISDGEYYPPECLETLQNASDGFCSASFTCNELPPSYGDGCVTEVATTVCEGTASQVFGMPEGFTASPFCQRATLSLDCSDFYTGDMSCWTDPQGVEHCPTNEGGNLAQCADLEADPSCAYFGRECVEGAQGTDGTCYVWTEKFDCGIDTTYSTLNALTSYDCAGPVSCFGTECIDPSFEMSSSYGRALAATQAAEFMAMDLQCTGTDGTEDVVCSVFAGRPSECKIAVGGVVDCCEKPSGISLANYISLILNMRKLDAMMTSSALNNTAIQGAWETLRQPVADTWSAVKEPFASAWDSMWGGAEGAGSEVAKEGIIAEFKQEMMNTIAEWVGEVFGTAARDALFTSAGQAGATGTANYTLGGTVGTALIYIYYVYVIYLIVMLIINLIWECEEAEFELGAQRELKNCHYVGSYCANDTVFGCIEKRESYCCFNSPLSRIIQEQVKPQFEATWGSAKDPECGGIPTDQLVNVDWSEVNLDEWLGILNITGNLKTTANINMESLSGSATLWGTGSDHLDPAERSVQRLEGLDTTGIRQDARDQLP